MPTITGISHIDLSVTDLDRSEAFYTQLLDGTRLLAGESDEHGYQSRYVLHPESMVIIGLVQHEQLDSDQFNERRVGLDHLSFNVADRSELDAWMARLDEQGIEHSGIAEAEMWDVLVLRDPDNIQLEFFWTKPAAAALLAG